MTERIYRTRPGRYSAGEAIGVLLLESAVPFIPGDVANATTFGFPVRYQPVKGYSVARAISGDASVYDNLRDAAQILAGQGVRAITGDCGFMALHQSRLANELGLPVFLSSLSQLAFIRTILGADSLIGIISADSFGISPELLAGVGIADSTRLVIAGLQDKPAFRAFGLEETGELDAQAVEREVVDTGREMLAQHPAMGAYLLECSLLPPYASALQEATGLPVFDYVTMVNYVFSAVVKIRYSGFV